MVIRGSDIAPRCRGNRREPFPRVVGSWPVAERRADGLNSLRRVVRRRSGAPL